MKKKYIILGMGIVVVGSIVNYLIKKLNDKKENEIEEDFEDFEEWN